MTRLILILTFYFIPTVGFGNIDTARILQQNEIDSLFTATVRQELRINFPIFRVYQYNDRAGIHFLVLTENHYNSNDENNESLSDTIRGFNLTAENGDLKIDWEVLDLIGNTENDVGQEGSIWFWTKYFSLIDLDNDGYIEPIIVYGSASISGFNGTDDGRIKILTYYKGAKRAIRHQNGILDFQRNTKVDSTFYKLPLEIQEYVKERMKKMTQNDHAIFPSGWEAAMERNELTFDER